MAAEHKVYKQLHALKAKQMKAKVYIKLDLFALLLLNPLYTFH